MVQHNPYSQLMRLDKPVGIWLLLIPCLWGIWVAPLKVTEAISLNLLFYNTVLFAIGAVVMRSAGCVINDYFDRELDKQVERTKNRPLASGIIPPRNALILFCILSFCGLLILLQLPIITLIFGCLVFIPIILYPLMKRLTYFPQLFLGLIYNSGIIMGFVTISGHFDMDILWLYASGVLITLGYDTIYAFQDINDDMKIGIKSSAIIWKNKPKLWIGLCYGLSLLFFGMFFYNKIAFYGLLIIAFIISVKLYFWHIADNHKSLKLFKENIWLLLALFGLIIFASNYFL
jgi:4-hydroxybenzoate polyprenyltransferase